MKWVNVKVNLPKGYKQVIVFDGRCKRVRIDTFNQSWFAGDYAKDITHWMPIPKIPDNNNISKNSTQI